MRHLARARDRLDSPLGVLPAKGDGGSEVFGCGTALGEIRDRRNARRWCCRRYCYLNDVSEVKFEAGIIVCVVRIPLIPACKEGITRAISEPDFDVPAPAEERRTSI